jgi:pimeloyl-ACP methyl ester carboxylesterase
MNWPDVSFIRVVANGIDFEVATMDSHPNTPNPCALGTPGSGDRLALCLHGFPENAYSWRHQMPLLARLGYRVWAPNLRGYGATDSPREISAYQPHTLIEDVASLIKVANPKETLVIAHDLGAVLAWALAITSQSRKSGTLGTSGLEQPQLIDRLVILNLPHPACLAREVRRPRQFFKSWYMLFFQLPWLPEKILGRRQGRGASELIRKTSCNPARFPDEALEIYRANAARPGGLRAMLNWYRAAFRSSELHSIFRGKVPTIDIPTLFLWGDQDVALNLRTTRGTEQYVSDLTFRIFPGVSHWIQQEAPEAVNAMLEAWLTGKPVPEYKDLTWSSNEKL